MEKGEIMRAFHGFQRVLVVTLLLTACSPALAALAGDAGTSAIEKLDPNFAAKDASGEWLWYDAKGLTVEGKGYNDTNRFYDRLPARAKGVVPDPVWSLSHHSAGLCVRFVTDAPKISARWKVLSDNLAMPHMPATGVSGLDLYVNDNGVWRWIGNSRPTGQSTEALLAGDIPDGSHEYMVYLPLYNGTELLEIGVVPTATLTKAPARPTGKDTPILFYGTSITHGGCASRPGMAYPAILGRRLDRPTINLGFSGNGKMEAELGALLAEVDGAARHAYHPSREHRLRGRILYSGIQGQIYRQERGVARGLRPADRERHSGVALRARRNPPGQRWRGDGGRHASDRPGIPAHGRRAGAGAAESAGTSTEVRDWRKLMPVVKASIEQLNAIVEMNHVVQNLHAENEPRYFRPYDETAVTEFIINALNDPPRRPDRPLNC